MKGMQIVYENRPYMHLDPAFTTAFDVFPLVLAAPSPLPVEDTSSAEQTTISIPVLEIDTTESPLSLVSPTPESVVSDEAPLSLQQDDVTPALVSGAENPALVLTAVKDDNISQADPVARISIVEIDAPEEEEEVVATRPHSDIEQSRQLDIQKPALACRRPIAEVDAPEQEEEEVIVRPNTGIEQSQCEIQTQEPGLTARLLIIEVDAPDEEPPVVTSNQIQDQTQEPELTVPLTTAQVQTQNSAPELGSAPTIDEQEPELETSRPPLVEETQSQPEPAVVSEILLPPVVQERSGSESLAETVPVTQPESKLEKAQPQSAVPTPPQKAEPTVQSAVLTPPQKVAVPPPSQKAEPTIQMVTASPPVAEAANPKAQVSKSKRTTTAAKPSDPLSFSAYAMFAAGFAIIAGGAFMFLRMRRR
jgi:hypothetical protein